MIENFNNKNTIVWEDLQQVVGKSSKLRVAAAIFSMYWFHSLKKELEKIDSMKFIFTDPTFIKRDAQKKENKLFWLQSNDRKKAVGWSEFEINLKNELKGKAIAKECKRRIEQKVTFKTNASSRYFQPQFLIENSDYSFSYSWLNEFSSAWFWFEKDNAIMSHILKTDEFALTNDFIKQFDSVWKDEQALEDITQEVIDYIANLYKENSPEYIYYITLYNIFDEFLEDISEDEIANERTWFKNSVIWNKLFDFQKDAVLWIINKLERHNGCILADSVWLGKTFTALGVVKYYQERNKSVLVLCPKKLWDNRQTYLANYEDNVLYKDRFNYDVLYHTDLSRERGESNWIDLSRINRWNYDLVVIDESHNFRNNDPRKDKVTRYQKLLNEVMRKWVKTKVLMLSATPVNNRFTDLKNQIALAYEWETDIVDDKMDIKKSINTILSNAQRIFNERSKLPVEERTGKDLLAKLNSNFDFFKLLDSITIARSRKHIEKYYDTNKIWKFPNRLKPITHRSDITTIPGFMSIWELYAQLSKLVMCIYTPFDYLLDSKKQFYADQYDTEIAENVSLKQTTRERSLQKLMKVNLLKRLESSVDSFRITLSKFIDSVDATLHNIEKFEKLWGNIQAEALQIGNMDDDISSDERLDEDNSIGNKIKINLADMNTSGWKEDLTSDLRVAQSILHEMERITPEYDSKLQNLKQIIQHKLDNPINTWNKKILIFSAFADTTNYLYKQLALYNQTLWLETAMISGTGTNQCTLPIDKQFNNLLIHFSPVSKERSSKYVGSKEIDILIATDCISEWQNLQDCDMLINYDIHWNPVRIIQRFGRIDRIWSKNKDIQLVNFWPQLSLDDYINLKNRVENRMFIVDATATGEDNVLTNESSDLVFRKKQLERLQEEVVDIEDMDAGISIMDLGLNDFRMDLVNYIKEKWSLEWIAHGMHSVCKKNPQAGIHEGVIFVLKNINKEINIDNTNQLHPFYMVYISKQGEIISNHLNVKNTLDILRSISKWQDEPIKELYEAFNEETDDGKNMGTYSQLLSDAIQSILQVKDESEVDSLFTAGGTTALVNTIKWLEDFELIAFSVIK